jgi:hypothetical protein
VLPLSIVGGVGLKISARIGYSQIWLHKIQLGQSWLQAPLQEGVEDHHQQLIAEAAQQEQRAVDGAGPSRPAATV